MGSGKGRALLSGESSKVLQTPCKSYYKPPTNPAADNHNLHLPNRENKMNEQVAAFLAGKTFAVVGASADGQKFGNKILRCYMDNGFTVYPINPKADEVEGLVAYKSLADLPEPVHGVSIVTPPAVTEKVVSEAATAGIAHIWMQPGAESAAAIDECTTKGLSLIHI